MERFQTYYTTKDLSKMTTEKEVIDDVYASILDDYNKRFGTEYKQILLRINQSGKEMMDNKKKLFDMVYSPPERKQASLLGRGHEVQNDD